MAAVAAAVVQPQEDVVLAEDGVHLGDGLLQHAVQLQSGGGNRV